VPGCSLMISSTVWAVGALRLTCMSTHSNGQHAPHGSCKIDPIHADHAQACQHSAPVYLVRRPARAGTTGGPARGCGERTSMARMPKSRIWMVAPAAYQKGPETPFL
jgi:hypothetical protein